MRPTCSTLLADSLLLLAAVIWGAAFVAQRWGMQHVGPMTFTGVRFALGAVVLLPVIWLSPPRGSTIPPRPRPINAPRTAAGTYVLGAMLAGLVLFLGATLQQIGLIYTTAGNAGFITGLYVIFVPILGIFIRHRAPATTWIGAVIATAGLHFLSVAGRLHVNPGDLLVLAGAVVWAAHVLIIGLLSPRTDPIRLAAIQFSVVAVLGLIAAFIFEDVTIRTIIAARWAILYAGGMSVGIAFTLQVIAQRKTPPAHAAILLSLESVFAALAGWIILRETLADRQLLGCALILAGILIAQIRQSKETWKPLQAQTPPDSPSPQSRL